MADSRLVTNLKSFAALPSTFSKGKALVSSGRVWELSEREGSLAATLRLDGKVASSNGGYYKVMVSLDQEFDEILDYSCTCPAAGNYPGMCKHEVALALQYAYPSLSIASTAKKPAKPRELPTSGVMRDLLLSTAEKRFNQAAAKRSRGGAALASAPAQKASFSVSLAVPSRSPSGDQLALKLTVHRGTTKYIAKNVAGVARAWREGTELTYGKKLSLVHTRDAVDERSARLLDLVCRIVDTQQALYLSRWDYVDGGRGTEVKELPLSNSDVCDVLDVMQGAAVQLECAGEPAFDRWGYTKPSTKLCEFSVGEGDPYVACSISESPNGGYEIEAQSGIRVILEGKRCYVAEEKSLLRTSREFAEQVAPVLEALSVSFRGLHLATPDVPEFCRSVLPALSAWCDVDIPGSLAAVVPPEPVFTFRVGLDDGEVSCKATVAYGAWSCELGGPENISGQPARDMAAEYHALDVIEDYFPIARGCYVFGEDDEELLFLLLTEGLPELSEIGEVFLSERLRSINVRQAPNLSVRATVKSNLLDVELGASGLTERELLEYLDGFKRKQKFVRLSTGDIVSIGESVGVAEELATGLGVEVEDLVGGDFGLPSSRALMVDALLEHVEGVRLTRNAGFRKIVRDFDSFAEADIEVPAGLRAELRGYQEDGFRWLGTLESLGFGGILADDMGLGKTLQVIAHILARKDCASSGDGKALAPTLVVCPASLVYNWMNEIERFAPTLDAVAVLGAKARRTAILGGADTHDVLVTSYDLLRRDVEAYTGIHFSRVVLDEAQYIKNPKTQVTKCAKCLDADVRFALTGTPIENRLQELWSIFDFLMPGHLGNRERFAKLYEGPVEAREHDSSSLLRCAIGPFVLRRLKSEVLGDLPEKTENVVYAQMEAKQRKLYLACQDRLALQVQHAGDREIKKDKLKVLAELTKLRQVCCDPSLYFEDYDGGSAKLDTCMELVSQAVDGGHKVLLFSQFTSMLSIIEGRLAQERVSHLVLTGQTSKEERERLVKRFQAGEADVFLISLKAGGVGLNLTAADVVIHYDPWWNTAAQDQATDRAHRIGQRRDVSVFKLIVKDTIEERILTMQEAKRGLAESVLSGEAVKSALLTRDDILALLGANQAAD